MADSLKLTDYALALRQMVLGVDGKRDKCFAERRGRLLDLSKLRTAAGVTQQQVADRLGKKRSAIGRMETSTVCSVGSAIEYAGACGFDLYVVAVKKGGDVVVL